MSRSKYSLELKLNVVKAYMCGDGSFFTIAQRYGVGKRSVRDWVCKYQAHGETGLIPREKNASYSAAFKVKCVKAVLNGDGNVDDITVKYNIAARGVLLKWIKSYNANKELKDYDPKREFYMAEARRKTTLAERKEITEYCISHDKNYKGTAALYDVSYSQVYVWVKKYLEGGDRGLEDRRGQHKSDDEVDELERLHRENLRLKRQLEEKDMVVELLKKVQAFDPGKDSRKPAQARFYRI